MGLYSIYFVTIEKSLSFVQVISLLGSGAIAVLHFCLHSVSYNICIQGCCGVEKASYVAAPKIPLKLLSLCLNQLVFRLWSLII